MTHELLAAALAAAEAGAVVLRRYFRTADLDIRRKARNDFVTRADGESEAAIVGLLRERFPDHHILAEERGIEPTLLANRADVHALAAGRRTGRLSSGWRSTVAGEPLRALFAGEAALTADGSGGVVLVEPGSARRSSVRRRTRAHDTQGGESGSPGLHGDEASPT